MSRMYKSDNGLVTMTGLVDSISEDKMSAKVTYDKWDITENKNVKTTDTVYTTSPIEEKVGDLVAVQGWVESSRGVSKIIAEIFSKENVYCEVQDGNKKTGEPNMKALIAGRVLFANERTEMNEDGTPKLNKAGQPRKPHFDITIATGRGEDRVTHVVKFYDFAARVGKDGKEIPAQHNIERYKKAFAKFDRETNPIYVWCMTTPGSAYQTTNGQYTNNNMSHMGATKMDLTYLNALEQTKVTEQEGEKEEETPIPTPTSTTPVSEQVEEKSGFDAGDIALDDNFDSEFTMD